MGQSFNLEKIVNLIPILFFVFKIGNAQNYQNCTEFLEDVSGGVNLNDISYYASHHDAITSTVDTEPEWCTWAIYAYINSNCDFKVSNWPTASFSSGKNCAYNTLLEFDEDFMYVNHCGAFGNTVSPIYENNTLILTFSGGHIKLEDGNKGHIYPYMYKDAQNKICKIENINFCVDKLICENGGCKCDYNHTQTTPPIIKHAEPLKKYEEDCKNDKECNKYLGHTCLKNKCSCNPGTTKSFQNLHPHNALTPLRHYHMNETFGKDYYAQYQICGRKVGEECMSNLCWPPGGAECKNHKCECSTDTYRRERDATTCLLKYKSICFDDGECSDEFECKFKFCDCPFKEQIYDKIENKCNFGLNQTCFPFNKYQCIPNSYCKSVNNNFICQCKKGYEQYLNSKGNLICAPGGGEKCKIPELNCHHNSLFCNENEICECVHKDHFYEGTIFKRCVGKVGSHCGDNSNCGFNMTCSFIPGFSVKSCFCAEGFEISDDKLCNELLHNNSNENTNIVPIVISGCISFLFLIVLIFIGYKFLRSRKNNPRMFPKKRNAPLLGNDH